jgi:hypothetical protein
MEGNCHLAPFSVLVWIEVPSLMRFPTGFSHVDLLRLYPMSDLVECESLCDEDIMIHDLYTNLLPEV